ncbi:MAG: TIGR04283 family arsenosugar biosynthesis glycosyltransferase [Pseudomonadota bacterium]
MAAPLSIVIPTYDAVHRLGPCLAALTEALGEGLINELIIADGGSRDDISTLADAVGAKLVLAPRGRGNQLAAGAQAARGEWYLFLHADTVLSPGWSAVVAQHIAGHPDRAGWFQLRFDTAGFWPWLVARWANLRARRLGLPYGDQGLLISKALYSAKGGYRQIALMEDVAMARALKGRLRPLPATATTSAERYIAEGWLRRGLRNHAVMLRYVLGASPDRLAARYDRGVRRG